MNGTRLFTVLSPGCPSPAVPIDMAIRICLASSPPVRSFVGNLNGSALLKHCEPLRPCLSASMAVATTPAATAVVGSNSSSSSSSPTWMSRRKKKKKKNVVFADCLGLALTAVHVFDEAEENLLTELQFQLTEIEGAAAGLCLGEEAEAADHSSVLALGFVEPAADYLHLRNRLKAQHVCLETCSVQERLLSGTVKVQNLSFQKWVWVRITFDSWRSFQDVPCLYMNNVYGCPDTDTFSFSISVPEDLRPPGAVEFCIHYKAQDRTFWDNNQDANYRLLLVDPKGSPTRGLEPPVVPKTRGEDPREKREGVEFDPFGSPRTSAGIFPEWQSWGHVESSTPYW